MYKILNIGERMYREDPSIIYSPTPIDGEWDAIVSYRYREKLPFEFLINYRCINLHTSFLPYNKGAYPNFFSHWDNTPTGVTIHRMSANIDEGNILLQKEVDFRPHITLKNSWEKLNAVVQNLFYENIPTLIDSKNHGAEQVGEGTSHKKKDFEEISPYLKDGWNTLIADIPTVKALFYIDKIEQVRARNNINWMDVLRIAVQADPNPAIKLIRKIAQCDNEINELLKQI